MNDSSKDRDYGSDQLTRISHITNITIAFAILIVRDLNKPLIITNTIWHITHHPALFVLQLYI